MVVGEFSTRTDLVVVGAGPAGIAAAARGRELGLDVTIVDHPRPLDATSPNDDLLTLEELASRGATVMTGAARFDGGRQLTVAGNDQVSRVRFRRAILAIGFGVSLPAPLDRWHADGDARLLTANEHAGPDLSRIGSDARVFGWGSHPEVVGWMNNVARTYPITVAQRHDGAERHVLATSSERLITGAAPGLEDDVESWAREQLARCGVGVRTGVPSDDVEEIVRQIGLDATDDAKGKCRRVITAAEGPPDLDGLGLDATDVRLDDAGVVVADRSGRTGDDRVLAAGRVRGAWTLDGGHRTASVASAEGIVAAESAAGLDARFEPQVHHEFLWLDERISWCRRLDAADVPDAERASMRAGSLRLTWERGTGVLLAAAASVGGFETDTITTCAAIIEMGGLIDDVAGLSPGAEPVSLKLALLARQAVERGDDAAEGGD